MAGIAVWRCFAVGRRDLCLRRAREHVHGTGPSVRPLGNDDWPRYYNLAFRSAPTRLAVGQPFEVELMRDAEHRVPDSVRIFYGYGPQLPARTTPNRSR